MMFLEVGYCVDPVTRQEVPLPLEYILYRLCIDVYGCPPSKLDDEDIDRLMQHLDFYNLEHKLGVRGPRQTGTE